MAWIDSHCHLQDEYRREGTSVAESAAQASASGVRGLVCVGTGPSSSREALAVVETLRSLPGPGQGPFEAWATVGLHPHDASTGLGEVVRVLEEAIGTNPGMVVAVGECGLDYHYDHSPREVQRDVFAQQV
ncbi:MAG TPA: TatD family hydrolase, partial [Acidimicrobiales bacterium]|nr:TatD family hydrolase [Acidimicrobiales bacterium]